MKNLQSAAVDSVHDVLVVSSGGFGEEPASVAIIDRAASGDVEPRALIRGPKTGLTFIAQLRVYPPKGWIIVPQQGTDPSLPEQEGIFVGVWSINDKGDVPPRWIIGGPKSTLKKPRGIALNPKDKELIVADMTLNAVLTYYFPEIF